MTRSLNPSLNSPNEADGSTEAIEALLAFRLGSLLLGVPAEQVQEICDRPEVSPIPLAPAHILGIMPLRGEAVALLDLHAFLDVPSQRESSDVERPPRAIVVSVEGMTVALTADRVLGIQNVALRDLQPVRIHGGSKLGAYLTAECDLEAGVLARVNLAALLAAARIRA